MVVQASGYQPPERFNFRKPGGWPRWIKSFQNYTITLKLDLEDEKRQVSSPLYAIGEKVDDIIDSFRFSDDNWNSYTTVRDKFKAYFVKKRIILFD